LFTAFESEGLEASRSAAGQAFSARLSGKPFNDGLVGEMAIAFFDVAFTRGANHGKTYATRWNTLTLDVWREQNEIVVVRGAARIEYPEGPLDLSFDALRVFG
jgi:hypothetical protein